MEGMTQKGGHKRPTDQGAGLTQKGVEKYRRQNPGSKLQTAVTTPPSKLKPGSKAAKRRKVFCEKARGWTGEAWQGSEETLELLTCICQHSEAQTSTCLDQHERSESLYSTDEESR